jgi:LPS-assembly lipoprotein
VKRLLILGGVLASGLALGGCGFTPLYAAPGVVPKLAAIDVTAPQGRTGFLLREHLDDAFAKNRSAPVAYTMRLSLGEARYPRGIRTDNTATRYEYVLTADYTLANAPAGDVAKRGKVRVEITYDSADQPYASIMAQQDAEDRAAEEAAHRIEIEVAAWLATGEPKTNAAKAPTIEPPPPNDFTAPASPASGTPKKG